MQGCEESTSTECLKIKAYFSTNELANGAAGTIPHENMCAPPKVFRIEDEDWNAKWRESMEPAQIADGWWVSPLWLPPPESDIAQWIRIEPKMAFGTGHHETTRLAAREIIGIGKPLPHSCLLDIGTGSGILCFIAERIGFETCIGIDIDPVCSENLHENLVLNTIHGGVHFAISPLAGISSKHHFSTIVMNMLFKESTPLLGDVTHLLQEDSLLIWSGILKEEKKHIIKMARSESLILEDEHEENEWWCGKFRYCKDT